jgi:hypothetical protein
VVKADITISQHEKAQLCPATAPTEFRAFDLVLPLQVSESAGVAAELGSLTVTPFLGATGRGGYGLSMAGFIFGTDTIEGHGTLRGVTTLPVAVDLGPDGPYTVRVVLGYRDINGFNLQATLDDLEIVAVAGCVEN